MLCGLSFRLLPLYVFTCRRDSPVRIVGVQSLKPAVHESCDRGPSNGFEYQITWILKGSEIKASGAGRAKKDARKIAVKNLLVQVGPVSSSVRR